MYTKFCGLCPDLKGMRSYRREEPFVAVGHDEIFSHDVSIVCGGLKELAEIFTLSMKEAYYEHDKHFPVPSCQACKLTLSILYCDSWTLPCWSIGWGCHLTVKNTWSVPGLGTSSFIGVYWDFCAISLAIALSSGWRAIASADSSKSMWVGEAARRTGAKAWLSNLFPMNRVNWEEKRKEEFTERCILHFGFDAKGAQAEVW